jgi:hypothetical protein
MMRNWFIPIALSLACSALAAPPQRVEIVYELSHNGVAVAEVTERLEHDGRRYSLQETWKGRGVFALRGEAQRSSRGAVARDGLRPAEYLDLRGGRERRRASFDPKDAAPTLQRQDRLSFVWSFVFAPPAGPVTVTVSDGRGASTYDYRPAGRERITTAAGQFDALRLVRHKDGPEGRSDEIWLAADRQFLPVRTVVTESDGTRIEMTAVRITTP